ncbi:MAG: [FeFe] hydrogenase H-cluster maturation GTPase HydF [Lachnospiraceae bacterium]|nr:[FeFe] hydrogenase H-cluster maturation GTPase HydF [Lachnospiraceae bacterium]
MGLNDTPGSERIHISFFGRRNAGKSSLVNAVTGQNLAVVSDVKGTTTDPVSKSMELLPLGPVLIIDTPGFDDEGELGELRVKKTKQVLNKTDIALLCVDSTVGITGCEQELIRLFEEKEIPYLVVYNKADLLAEAAEGPVVSTGKAPATGIDVRVQTARTIFVSAKNQTNITELKELIGSTVQVRNERLKICGDLIHPGDFVVLVTPIDSAAPKGRMILPQQQTIRDVLEADGVAVVIKEDRLKDTLAGCAVKPKLVITDSQAFERVAQDTPDDILLTSFSILMARYKGFLRLAVQGAARISQLQDGDKILIAEGCTHHRQCADIGTVKLPRWLGEFTGKKLIYETCSGTEFKEALEQYALIIHCGGCMLNEREIRWRMKTAQDAGVPVTNYGTAIAYMKGILERSLLPLPDYGY